MVKVKSEAPQWVQRQRQRKEIKEIECGILENDLLISRCAL
jgi:hypothetical protein